MKTLLSNEIAGNWCTLLMATDSDGKLDISKLNDEVDALIAARPDGIYSNGTAGEFYTQTDDEFMQISELLSQKCHKADVPFQIGISHPCADVSLERLKLVKSLKPSALQLILPDWFPVNDREAVAFLKRIEENADGLSLILYNPPHAKRRLAPAEWAMLKEQVPSLQGVKVSDGNSDPEWYEQVRKYATGISVFVPGHHLATGIKLGAHGAYSNVACISPAAAQRWYDMMLSDMDSALELQGRIQQFMKECIDPFIVEMKYPNPACDRFMAAVGGWADVGTKMRWPYDSIPESYIEPVRKRAIDLIPEFF